MARLRAECLDAEVFFNLADAKLKLNLFRRYYNQVRPHSRVPFGQGLHPAHPVRPPEPEQRRINSNPNPSFVSMNGG